MVGGVSWACECVKMSHKTPLFQKWVENAKTPSARTNSLTAYNENEILVKYKKNHES